VRCKVTEALERQDLQALGVLSVATMTEQVKFIQDLMRAVMKDGEHYGTIPGTTRPGAVEKKALYKAGAEKLSFVFRLRPEYQVEVVDLGDRHREVRVRCTLVSLKTDKSWGEGVGSCSTMESKYRWRYSERECPICRGPFIRRSRYDDDNGSRGWYCHGKAGGCGEQFPYDTADILDQVTGKVENPDIADVYNTVLKMGKKRAHTDAVLTALAASDIFTQDIGDDPAEGPADEETEAPAPTNSAAAAKPTPPRRRSEAAKVHEERVARSPAAPNTTITRGKVVKLTAKPTNRGGSRYTVQFQPEGPDPQAVLYVHTFDQQLAEEARQRGVDKLPVLLEWKPNPNPQYGNDLIGIKTAPSALEEPPEEFENRRPDLPF
jgi:hypothetical protein